MKTETKIRKKRELQLVILPTKNKEEITRKQLVEEIAKFVSLLNY